MISFIFDILTYNLNMSHFATIAYWFITIICIIIIINKIFHTKNKRMYLFIYSLMTIIK